MIKGQNDQRQIYYSVNHHSVLNHSVQNSSIDENEFLGVDDHVAQVGPWALVVHCRAVSGRLLFEELRELNHLKLRRVAREGHLA